MLSLINYTLLLTKVYVINQLHTTTDQLHVITDPLWISYMYMSSLITITDKLWGLRSHAEKGPPKIVGDINHHIQWVKCCI